MRGNIPALALSALLLAACGSAASAAPTPTPVPVLAQEYLKAANEANQAQDVLISRLGNDCKTLNPCQQDFASFSKIENTFAAELRAIKVPTSMEADRRAVLDIERRYANLEDDAAQATSLDQINTDWNAIQALSNQFGDAVDHLRLDLGLPAAPTLTATPSASV
jgi:hypothetical protein